MALLANIEQFWPKVAYNGLVFVMVSKYDTLGPYLSLHYLF